MPVELSDSPAVANREQLAAHLRTLPADEIMKNYIYMTRAQAISEFGTVFRLLAPWHFAGRGLEVGAGLGVFSSMVTRGFPEVESIHAVEVVRGVVRDLQPIVARHVAGARADRVVGVVGSFDDMAALGDSFDFCIEIGSLHHSDDLDRTLREISTRLKPGGTLVALDRAHRDGLPDVQRRLMLDLEYSAAWKRANHYPDAPLTRRQNGEHEITLGEWRAAFARAGLELTRRFELRIVSWGRLFRACLLTVPFSLRRRLGWLPTRPRPQAGEAWWMLRRLLGGGRDDALFHAAMRDHTLFVARKI